MRTVRTASVSDSGLHAKQLLVRGSSGANVIHAQALTPTAMLAIVRAGRCPWCPAGPYRAVTSHISKKHGVGGRELRDMLGVPYCTSLIDPDLAASCADRARDRPPPVTPAAQRRRRQLSLAARRTNRAKLEAARSPAQVAAALAAMHTPEARARAAAALRQTWLSDPRRWTCTECGGGRRPGRSRGAITCSPECETARRRARR